MQFQNANQKNYNTEFESSRISHNERENKDAGNDAIEVDNLSMSKENII